MSRSLTESFTSLSNDSQRLFVRLYTRKGNWNMWNLSIFICSACNIYELV